MMRQYKIIGLILFFTVCIGIYWIVKDDPNQQISPVASDNVSAETKPMALIEIKPVAAPVDTASE